MRGVGQGMQEFKKATADHSDDDEIIVDEKEDTKKVKDGKK
jgi:Sec-independent protein translocase protein TatA